MTFEKTAVNYGKETEVDEKGNYNCIITIGIVPSSDLIPPFSKDIAYLKGFVMIYNFMRTTIKEGRADLIPFLFAGKVTLEDLPVLYDYHKEGVITLPKYLPPQIRDLNGLAIWMAFSNFLNRMKLEDIMQEKKNSEKKAA